MSRGSRILLAAMLGFYLASPALANDVVVQLGAGDGFVIEDSGSGELLRVEEATGNISKDSQLFLHNDFLNGNLFLGTGSGFWNSTGALNTAFGETALTVNTTGSRNAAFGPLALVSNISGNDNTAFGPEALRMNTASQNAAFGTYALYANQNASDNSAFGYIALGANTTGVDNTAVGSSALDANMTGNYNVAVGEAALGASISGNENTAIGRRALVNLTSGASNIAIGPMAGDQLTSGSSNIYIGNAGTSSESDTIRIGQSLHAAAFIGGIYGATSASGTLVFINSSDQLGTATSSIRFKEAVRDMEGASRVLMKMRPVTFRYKEEVAGGENIQQYGLIAEEVAQVEPGLVAYDEEGKPYAVRYHFLAPMLVNEYQKQQRTIDQQAAVIAKQEARIGDQGAAIEQLTARLECLEAEVGRVGR